MFLFAKLWTVEAFSARWCIGSGIGMDGCGYAAAYKSNLTAHKLKHSGEK